MNQHTLRVLLTLISVAWLGLAAAGELKVNGCLECHYADDFKGEAAENIAQLIRNNAKQDSEHPADLSGLSAEEIAEIAAYLSRGGEE